MKLVRRLFYSSDTQHRSLTIFADYYILRVKQAFGVFMAFAESIQK